MVDSDIVFLADPFQQFFFDSDLEAMTDHFFPAEQLCPRDMAVSFFWFCPPSGVGFEERPKATPPFWGYPKTRPHVRLGGPTLETESPTSGPCQTKGKPPFWCCPKKHTHVQLAHLSTYCLALVQTTVQSLAKDAGAPSCQPEIVNLRWATWLRPAEHINTGFLFARPSRRLLDA